MAINWNSDVSYRFEDASKTIQRAAQPVLEFFSAGFEITWFETRDTRLWAAFLKPLPSVRERYALDKEFYLIGHDYEQDLQKKTFQVEPHSAEAYRLNPQVRFLASSAPGLREACASWSMNTPMMFVPVETQVLRHVTGPQKRQELLHELLRGSLWQVDRFDESEPVHSPGEFYGRESLVQQVLHKCVNGSPLAVFGLRKIGKTSLLRRVQQRIEGNTERLSLSAFVQCNRVDIKSGRSKDVLRQLIEQWLRSARMLLERTECTANVDAVAALKKVLNNPRKSSDPAAIFSAFRKDFDALHSVLGQVRHKTRVEQLSVVAFFDEVDHIYPHLEGSNYWRQEFFDLWDGLQTTLRDHDSFAFVLCGVNPAGIEQGSLLGRPNPLFSVSRIYVKPMPREEASELMRGLGRPMGLQFDDEAVQRAHELVSGHPALLRQLGSLVHRQLADRTDNILVNRPMIEQVYARHKRSFLQHVEWILTHLKTVAPDEHRLLLDLCRTGSLSYFTEWAQSEFRDAFAQHLADYGLIDFHADRPRVQMSVIVDAIATPKSGTFESQLLDLQELCGVIERLIRSRLASDLARERSLDDAVEIIVGCVPAAAHSRPRNREQLRQLGLASGLRAVVDSLNWEDYILLVESNYESLALNPAGSDKQQVISRMRDGVKRIHLVRHNNQTELRSEIERLGFPGFAASITWIRELFSS